MCFENCLNYQKVKCSIFIDKVILQICIRETQMAPIFAMMEKELVFLTQGVQVQVWPKHKLVHPAAQFSCSSKVFTLLSEQNNVVDSV